MSTMLALRNTRSFELDSIKFKKDGDGYYFELRYTVETDTDIRKIHIPKARLPIKNHSATVSGSTLYKPFTEIDIGFGPLSLDMVDGVAYTETITEKKTKEMTLAEIEKELGHKIKIVNEH